MGWMKRPDFDTAFSDAGRRLPRPALRAALRASLDGLQLALCLHRVGPPRATDLQKAFTQSAEETDALLELLLEARPGERFLTVTFDDGYQDALDYVRSRAAKYPEADFLLFVCPAKAERRLGFRWDLAEEQVKQGAATPQAAQAQARARLEPSWELERTELHALAQQGPYALATVEALQAVRALPNVKLGNHTNSHFALKALPEVTARHELLHAHQDFVRLFGPQQDFAFPFGTPDYEFDASHVKMLRGLSEAVLWSTERRPYRRDEVRPGAVLPRFPVDGRRGPHGLAGWLAARAALFRLRGTRFHYP